MTNLFDIKDHVVVITGGTGVLGRCIGKYLAEQGAKVAILGRNQEVGLQIVENIKADGGTAKFYQTDVMDKGIVEQNCSDILADFGTVDALLNAAGGNMPGATIGPKQDFFDLDPEQFQKVLNLN
ncbi:MAG: SDR family NAD(P)-dependent oxidoreductase, partial [Prevotella sp.]